MRHAIIGLSFPILLIVCTCLALPPAWAGRPSVLEIALPEGVTGSVSSLAFSPDAHALAVATENHILIYEVPSGDLAESLPALDTDNDPFVCFVSGGRMLAVRTDEGVSFWSLHTGKLVRAVARPQTAGLGQTQAISPSGRTIAEVVQAGAGRAWITAVRLKTGAARRFTPAIRLSVPPGPSTFVRGIDYSPDGRIVIVHVFVDYSTVSGALNRASGGDDYWLFYDARTRRALGRTPDNLASYGPLVYSSPVVFSPDGRHVAFVDANRRRAYVYPIAQRDGLPRYDRASGMIPIAPACLAFSADGRTIATGSRDFCVKLWHADQHGIMRSFRLLAGHTGNVTALAFSPDDRLLASAAADGSVRIWKL
jgi:WD40 repeat protein